MYIFIIVPALDLDLESRISVQDLDDLDLDLGLAWVENKIIFFVQSIEFRILYLFLQEILKYVESCYSWCRFRSNEIHTHCRQVRVALLG